MSSQTPNNGFASTRNCEGVRHPREVVAHEYFGLWEGGGYEALVFWCCTHKLPSIILEQIAADWILIGRVAPVECKKNSVFGKDRLYIIHNGTRALVV